MAHGPRFQAGFSAPHFDNIEVYNLLCGESWAFVLTFCRQLLAAITAPMRKLGEFAGSPPTFDVTCNSGFV